MRSFTCEFEHCRLPAICHLDEGGRERHYCQLHLSVLFGVSGESVLDSRELPDFSFPLSITSSSQLKNYRSSDQDESERIFKEFHAVKCNTASGELAFLFSEESYSAEDAAKLWFVMSGWNPKVVATAPHNLFVAIAQKLGFVV